ncbi:MAG: hypothetical protein ABIP49_09040 [Lysobacterales bacterium]
MLTFDDMVLVGHGEHMLLRRVQGEARLLAAPNSGPPLGQIDRPARLLVRTPNQEFLIATSEFFRRKGQATKSTRILPG